MDKYQGETICNSEVTFAHLLRVCLMITSNEQQLVQIWNKVLKATWMLCSSQKRQCDTSAGGLSSWHLVVAVFVYFQYVLFLFLRMKWAFRCSNGFQFYISKCKQCSQLGKVVVSAICWLFNQKQKYLKNEKNLVFETWRFCLIRHLVLVQNTPKM